MKPLATLVLALAVALMCAQPGMAQQASASPFAKWAAVIVAGDYRDHAGQTIEVFDNARRDLTAALIKTGFAADHVGQFSVYPGAPAPGVQMATPENIIGGLERLTATAPDGCLLYFTSHGSPEGIVMGNGLLPPATLSTLVNRYCGEKPAIVMVSACYSGVFVKPLAGPNRMVMTAARPDRTSFGCGASLTYTFFDECVLKAMPAAKTFETLAAAIQTCVTARETQMFAEQASYVQADCARMTANASSRMTANASSRMTALLQCQFNRTDEVGLPSEPQVSIGAQMKTLLPLLRLNPGTPG